MIDTAEVRYFACMWFAPTTNKGDFMGILYQRHDLSWEMKYRFRYYASSDSDGDGADDEKSWYVMKLKGSSDVDAVEAELDRIVGDFFGGRPGTEIEKVEIRGNAVKLIEVMATKGWAKFETSSPGGPPS